MNALMLFKPAWYPTRQAKIFLGADPNWHSMSHVDKDKLLSKIKKLSMRGKIMAARIDSHNWPSPQGFYTVIYQKTITRHDPKGYVRKVFAREPTVWPCARHPNGC